MVKSFFMELKRRNVFKVGVAYLAGSWLLVEAVGTILTLFGYSDSVTRFAVIVLAIGLIPVLIFTWVYDYNSKGLVKESEIDRTKVTAIHISHKLDFIIIGLLVIGMGYFIWESRFEDADSTDTADVTQVTGTSIAVLPFVNMSDDVSNEYFSDGISEEILNVLAKIPKLHVTSRSSAFAFKGSKINISEVAAKLGVKNVLEGSVRKSGNHVRVTAQLIEAGSDKYLWSESYDRELTDIFVIQDEISAAIAEALKSKLGLDIKVAARDMSKVNLEAHNEYLKGRFYVENRNQADIEKALFHFDTSIALASDYAPAWMGKAWATVFLSEFNYGNIPLEVALETAQPAIAKALQLDPSLPETHGIMGLIELTRFKFDKAIVHFKKAIELNPNYADVYSWYANTQDGHPKKRLELREKAIQLSPMSILANNNYASDLLAFGRIDEVSKIAENMLTINDSHRFPYSILGGLKEIEGNYAEAAIFYGIAVKHSPGNIQGRVETAEALVNIGLAEQGATFIENTSFEVMKYRFLGNHELYISQLREIFPRNDNDVAGLLIRAYAESGAENCGEAVKYFKLAGFNDTNKENIYCLQQIGDIEAADALLEKLKKETLPWIEAGVMFYPQSQPIDIRTMEIAYLEGDIKRAINDLKLAADKNFIVDFELKTLPMYKKLRAQPEWSALLAESDKRAAVQREIYFKLIAEEENASL